MLKTLTRGGLVAGLVFTIALTLGLPARADAQYFGQNKVQYDKFDFQVLKTEHFDIYYYPARSGGRRSKSARMAERWYARLSRPAGSHAVAVASPSSCTPAIPNSSRPTSSRAQSTRARAASPKARGAASCCRWRASLADTDHVLGHELVHAFQYDILGPNGERAAAVVHRGHGRVPVARRRGTRRRRCGCATPRSRTACRRSRTSTIRGTSRTASATRSGRTSAAR